MRRRGWVAGMALLAIGPSGNARAAEPKADPRSKTAPAVASSAAPATIPFQLKKVDSHSALVTLKLSIPVFDHPRPGARTAIATLVDRELERFVKYGPAPGNQGSVELSCEVATATTSVISFACRSMVLEGSIADHAKAIGGAPAERTVSTLLLLIDGDDVRKGALDDLLANPDRDEPAILKKVQAALSGTCPKLRLLPGTPADVFTVGPDGVRFYFPMMAFALDNDFEAACPREATLSRASLTGLLRPGGVLDRLR
jgi:hypothetical protein